jgi:type I restriction enzyme R subunit
VLVYRNHKLAVLEANAWDEELTEGVAQAKNYAGKLGVRYTYASNGQSLYAIDMEEGEVSQYPSPAELWNLTFAEPNAWRDSSGASPRQWTCTLRLWPHVRSHRQTVLRHLRPC